jgi:predicted TIM-barrel fold metal-dependent hydrolase
MRNVIPTWEPGDLLGAGLAPRPSRPSRTRAVPAGLALAEPMNLADNFMRGNDYPHHEGTWPHSAEAIERTMGHLSDAARGKVLGLNAARLFGFEVRG